MCESLPATMGNSEFLADWSAFFHVMEWRKLEALNTSIASGRTLSRSGLTEDRYRSYGCGMIASPPFRWISSIVLFAESPRGTVSASPSAITCPSLLDISSPGRVTVPSILLELSELWSVIAIPSSPLRCESSTSSETFVQASLENSV